MKRRINHFNDWHIMLFFLHLCFPETKSHPSLHPPSPVPSACVAVEALPSEAARTREQIVKPIQKHPATSAASGSTVSAPPPHRLGEKHGKTVATPRFSSRFQGLRAFSSVGTCKRYSCETTRDFAGEKTRTSGLPVVNSPPATALVAFPPRSPLGLPPPSHPLSQDGVQHGEKKPDGQGSEAFTIGCFGVFLVDLLEFGSLCFEDCSGFKKNLKGFQLIFRGSSGSLKEFCSHHGCLLWKTCDYKYAVGFI